MVGLGQKRFGGGGGGGGGNCLKYLKRGGTEKRGGDTNILKRWGGGKLGQGVDSLKKGGWNPLTNYGLQMSYFLEFCGEINEIYLK